MPALVETLTSFVPQVVVRRLAADPTWVQAPQADRFPAAALFADISGFTRLTERLAAQGPAGVEELTGILNSYFGQLIALITAHGGDIVKFAGDALLALWPADGVTGDAAREARGQRAAAGNVPEGQSGVRSPEPALATHPSLAEATARAAGCALAVQAQLAGYQAAGGARLLLRIGIGAGAVSLAQVGGVGGRWELLLAGPVLHDMSAAQQAAAPGEVVLAPAAWAQVGAGTGGDARPGGAVRLVALAAAPPPRPLARLTPAPALELALRAYIPGAVLDRLTAGQTGWLAELRRITVIFLNLPALSQATPAALDRIQDLMATLQTVLAQYEGSINKLSVDDKGVSLVAAMGLPPLAHADDAARGVGVALAVQEYLRAAGVAHSIGVTTGRAFCGAVGSSLRREYTMVGDVVNLAARLMQAAGAAGRGPWAVGRDVPAGQSESHATRNPGPIPVPDDPKLFLLCDAATQTAAAAQVRFAPLPALRVKGKAAPVAVYAPVGLATAPAESRPMVGRRAERAVLAGALLALRRGEAGVLVIEGEAGIGKSRLLDEGQRQARALGVTVLRGAASTVEQDTPYYAWRPVFAALFALDGEAAPAARATVVRQRLQADPAALRLAPLLDPVLPGDWPDNAITAQMTGQVRADNTRELLSHLLARAAQAAPLALLLEDAHWMDSASWGLALAVARRPGPRPLLILATRPLPDPLPPDVGALLGPEDAPPGTHRLPLDSLPDDEILALVSARLGVPALPAPVAALIRERAEGNPFFAEELAYALRDTGLIEITDGTCRIAPGAPDPSAGAGPTLATFNVPDTLQGVITSRIDRLTPQQQLTLKVASVIGRIFEFRALYAVHPIAADRAHLGTYLGALAHLDLTPLDRPDPDRAYIFKHAITQEVAYNLMLFAQRRDLHRAVAAWLEQAHAADLDPFAALLAYHWDLAGDAAKTAAYLDRAGTQALRNGAYREAVRYFEAALERKGRSQNVARAAWERQLGEAYYGLNDLAASRTHLLAALAGLGRPMPTTPGGLLIGTLGATLHQVAHRLGLRRRPPRGAAATAQIEAARAYERLGQIYYLDNHLLPSFYTGIRGLNLAERQPPTPELARAYASISMGATFIPARRLARAYGRRARQTALAVNDLGARIWVAETLGLAGVSAGDWPFVHSALSIAQRLAEHVRDGRRWIEVMTLQAVAHYYEGRFRDGLQFAAALDRWGQQHDNTEARTWSRIGHAGALLPLGRVAEALPLLEATAAELTNQSPYLDRAWTHSVLAVAYLYAGQPAAARQAAAATAALLAQNPAVTIFSLHFEMNLAEVYLGLWEAGDPQMRPVAHRACRTLEQRRRIFPIVAPRAARFRGRIAWRDGRPPAARRAWARSLRAARRLQIPYEEALAYYEIGCHLPPGAPARRAHLAHAQALLTHLGAGYYLARVQAALDAPAGRARHGNAR